MTATGLRVPGIAAVLWFLLVGGCDDDRPESGKVLDEASRADRPAATFTAAAEDYFKDMDRGVALTPDEIKGRNMWIVWTGGNDRFWDAITRNTVGNFDLLKTISSYPGLKGGRDSRWEWLGLVNEPCFEKATGPDPERFNLWLDKRRSDCPPDPFADEQKYPGAKIGARGKNVPVGSYYGYPTGIVGLRIFPNPDFDEAAARNWDPRRYYDDPSYYLSKDLVRPYRVGMSCGFCHVGPSPTRPPVDPNNPKWENLSSTVGAQYLWIDRIFVWSAGKEKATPEEDARRSFVYQLVHTSRPGTLDTSLVSTDNINNPRTMNAIYALGPRLEIARRWGKETLSGGNLLNRQFNDYVKEGPLTEFFQAPDTVWTPHILKDASDSVGALGALNRVYLNIGLFSEEWMLHFNALVGGKPITPIEIAVAEKNSAYWKATEAQTPNMALFLLKTGAPDRLKDAPGGQAFLTTDQDVLNRGKLVFADRCARCHSSKLPAPAPGLDPAGCGGPGYLDCWNRYWSWTKTEEYKRQMRQIVMAPDFLDANYLSTDVRVPVTLLQTNACSSLATNAIAENIWDNFSSKSYKDLPSVGTITVYDPFTGELRPYPMPAGGRGYTRPASLISMWSTAPFLQNNSLGTFDPSPSVEARMKSFQSSIEALLWPEKREKDSVLGDKIPGVIDRTTDTSFITVPEGYLPDVLRPLQSWWNRLLPWLFTEGGDVRIGPIPKGTPVGLLANIDLLDEGAPPAERALHAARLAGLLLRIKQDLKELPPGSSDDQARQVFANLARPMLELSKCPDLVVNRGHYFGTDAFAEEPGLSNQEKRDLIEFLKTF